MRITLLALLITMTTQAQGLYLVLTPAQFTTANNWVSAQNGWPDGKGTVRYAEPFAFSQFSNCPAPLADKVGLVFDKALIRHCRQPGESKEDAIVRVASIVRENLSNPTVVRVVPTGGDIDGPQEAYFTDVTSIIVERLRELVQ